MIGGFFCEVNRRRRSRRGIRETTSNHPTVVGLWMYQYSGLSKCYYGLPPIYVPIYAIYVSIHVPGLMMTHSDINNRELCDSRASFHNFDLYPVD
jgi:hypothetical protein